MSSPNKKPYVPDYVGAPGRTLRDTIEYYGMSQSTLAKLTGRPTKTINEIIKGKAAITPETALQFERVLGVPAAFWLNYERHYREGLARKKEQKLLNEQLQWLSDVPVSAMTRLNWIEKHKDLIEQLQVVLSFFGIASPAQWSVLERTYNMASAFRKSPAFTANPKSVIAWLRRGEILARERTCAPFNKPRFRKALSEIRSLTRTPPDVFEPRLVELCAACGVAVILVHELPKIRMSGATRWLTSKKALIQLSLRHKTDDHLWFTFFHEAGHILLHGKKKTFVDEENQKTGNAEEQEANRFAEDTLIPKKDFQRLRRLCGRGRISGIDIESFAEEIGISPGIVVGRLQHEGLLRYNQHNSLKKTFEWKQ